MMRDRFKRGEIKILVVTSVADEGINIMECNLIVKYNSVGSERTLIQRRGRARDKDSKAILLALDTNVEQQEFDNMKKEALMLACINDLQSIQDEALQKMVIFYCYNTKVNCNSQNLDCRQNEKFEGIGRRKASASGRKAWYVKHSEVGFYYKLLLSVDWTSQRTQK